MVPEEPKLKKAESLFVESAKRALMTPISVEKLEKNHSGEMILLTEESKELS